MGCQSRTAHEVKNHHFWGGFMGYWIHERILMIFKPVPTMRKEGCWTGRDLNSSATHSIPHFSHLQNPVESQSSQQGDGMQRAQIKHSKGVSIGFLLPHSSPFLMQAEGGSLIIQPWRTWLGSECLSLSLVFTGIPRLVLSKERRRRQLSHDLSYHPFLKQRPVNEETVKENNWIQEPSLHLGRTLQS